MGDLAMSEQDLSIGSPSLSNISPRQQEPCADATTLKIKVDSLEDELETPTFTITTQNLGRLLT